MTDGITRSGSFGPAAELARLVYPTATVGLYCPEEMGDAA